MLKRYTLPEMGKVWREENRFKKYVEIEVLVCEALAQMGQIPKEAARKIRKKVEVDIKRIKEIEKVTRHETIAFIEAISEKLGKEARFLHLGLTSSDVLDTALALQLKESASLIIKDLEDLIKTLLKKARKYKDTVMVGRTHGIHAEPTTFGLKLLLWAEECRRNLERMRETKEMVSYGKISGPVGTYSNIDPMVEKIVLKRLNLKPASVSTQIIQRDRQAYYLSTLALVATSLEKFALLLRNLQRTEIGEVEEPFAPRQKGSSAMPHKRNPIIGERICGLARVVRGNLLAGLENIPLWEERDISHSSVERIIIPDSSILVDYMLHKFREVMEGLKVYSGKMRENLGKTKGLIFSEKVLLELMKKGLSRKKAYFFVQRNAFRAKEKGLEFKDCLLNDKEVTRHLKPREIEGCFDLRRYLRNVNKIYKRLNI
ncbi:MAG TPA: adenylosuccinate lyase [bacterium]|nr:adenylosuccinate lyase [bacterium]